MPDLDPETQAEPVPSSIPPHSAELRPSPGEGVKRLRGVVVRSACVLSLLVALVLACWSVAAARGFLLGAGAGILPFWLFGRQVERAALHDQAPVEPLAPRWTLLRIGLSIAALLIGYSLSPGSAAGLLSALAGLFVTRAVLVTLALTGLDLRIGKS